MDKTLRSTDLMLGDYVIVKTSHIEYPKKLVRDEYVTRVTADLIMTLTNQEMGFRRPNTVGYVYVEPILIEKKIFDDSGLERCKDGSYLYDRNDGFEIFISEYDEQWRVDVIFISYDTAAEPIAMQTVFVKYVQELQHTLKLYTGTNDTRIKL